MVTNSALRYLGVNP